MNYVLEDFMYILKIKENCTYTWASTHFENPSVAGVSTSHTLQGHAVGLLFSITLDLFIDIGYICSLVYYFHWALEDACPFLIQGAYSSNSIDHL
jgi:hypothetical protein